METSEQNPNFYLKSVEDLSSGILSTFQPSLVEIQKQLKELTDKQTGILTQVHNENLELAQVQHSNDLEQMFNKMRIYQIKLVNVKKDIRYLHERSQKLKKRALKLQQIKEKEDYLKHQKELDLKKEEELIGAK